MNCRLSEEVVEMNHELNELRKHISAQGILVQDLINGACQELSLWSQANANVLETQESELGDNCLIDASEDDHLSFLESIDILLAEHKIEEAIEAIDAEEKSHPEMRSVGETSPTEPSAYRSALSKRKAMLEKQLVEITERPSIAVVELKRALSGLLKLGKGPLAHQLLVKSIRLRLQKKLKLSFHCVLVILKHTQPLCLTLYSLLFYWWLRNRVQCLVIILFIVTELFNGQKRKLNLL